MEWFRLQHERNLFIVANLSLRKWVLVYQWIVVDIFQQLIVF
jgi:hypothetical protein